MTEKRGFELESEISRLQKLLDKSKIELDMLRRNCNHKWSNAVYDPETVYKFQTTHCEMHGGIPILQGYERPVQKDRWSKTCENCGEKEYTYEQKPIIVGYEPSFGR